MSYKIHCYAHIFNQVRNLGEISLSFVPRVDDLIKMDTDNSNYEGKVIGQVFNVEVDTAGGDELIICHLGQVKNV